jgi:hypothetical protein
LAQPAKKRTQHNKKKPVKKLRFQLSYVGLAGAAVVCCCLFLWMFLLGIWAGQTILLPTDGAKAVAGDNSDKELLIITPDATKRVVRRQE